MSSWFERRLFFPLKCQNPCPTSTAYIHRERAPFFLVTWETGRQVFHQCFLGDRLSCRVHCGDGQAKDFPEWNKLRLTDGGHTDWWHITCRKTIFKWVASFKHPTICHTQACTMHALSELCSTPCIMKSISFEHWSLLRSQRIPLGWKDVHAQWALQ